MSRAAFLPTPGDPFLLNLWFKYYEKWFPEIDRLYVYVNSDSPKPVIRYIEALATKFPNTLFMYNDRKVEHGDALKAMLNVATEDYIMFVEDDGFIFRSGFVEDAFSLIEQGLFDMVGSKRGSCSAWLYEEASRKWDLDNTGYGDHGPNFWPNFFFARREDLLKVTNFGARHWKIGELVEPLGKPAPEEQASDTFVEGSLQLRAMGLQPGYVPQLHGNTDDLPDYENKAGIWGPEAGWLHVGSLSSGFHGMLKPNHQADPEHFSTEQEKLELERRIVFWKWGLEEAAKEPGLPQVKRDYQRALQHLIETYTLSLSRIERRKAIYKEVMG